MDLTNSHASGKIKDILFFFKDIFSEGIGNDEYIFMGDTFGDSGNPYGNDAARIYPCAGFYDSGGRLPQKPREADAKPCQAF